MITRLTRIFALILVLDFCLGVRSAIGEGWSLPKLFPESKTETKKISPKSNKSQPITANKSQPSTLSKLNTGTKKFFNDVGNALTFKKSSSPKKAALPSNPWIKPAKNEPSKPSWLTSIFSKEEPKKYKDASEWLEQKRLDP